MWCLEVDNANRRGILATSKELQHDIATDQTWWRLLKLDWIPIEFHGMR